MATLTKRVPVLLDPFQYERLKEIARQRGATISKVLSDLAQRAATRQANGETRHGVPLFPVQPDARPVTLELVNQLRDEVP